MNAKLTDDQVYFILKSLMDGLGLTVFGGSNVDFKMENLKKSKAILNNLYETD